MSPQSPRIRTRGHLGTLRCPLLAVLMTVYAAVAVLPAVASASTSESHCVIHVDQTGGTTDLGCYASRSAASTAASSGLAADRIRSSSSTLSVHFSSQSFTGSSITITGAGCTGAIWKPSAGWNNNIESSYHYCGLSPTRFYDSSSCSGTSRAIYSAATTLYSMNNLASCVRYG